MSAFQSPPLSPPISSPRWPLISWGEGSHVCRESCLQGVIPAPHLTPTPLVRPSPARSLLSPGFPGPEGGLFLRFLIRSPTQAWLLTYQIDSKEMYSDIRKNKTMPSAATRMDAETVIVSEVSQRDKCHMISLVSGI